jgi:hypothetical protein
VVTGASAGGLAHPAHRRLRSPQGELGRSPKCLIIRPVDLSLVTRQGPQPGERVPAEMMAS